MKSGVTNLWQNNLVKQVVLVIVYLSLFWLVHTAVISIVVFFHFSLDHNLSTIDSWIKDEAWKIIIVSKIITLVPILKLCFLYSNERNPFRSMLKRTMLKPRRQILVICVFSVLLILSLGRPEIASGSGFNISRFFWAFMGVSVFYFTDVILYLSLQIMLPLTSGRKYLSAALFSLLAGGVYVSSIVYAENLSFLVAFFLFFLCTLCLWRSENWVDPLIFILFPLSALAGVFGFDPIWSHNFTPFSLSTQVSELSLISILLVSFLYLLWNQKMLRTKMKY